MVETKRVKALKATQGAGRGLSSQTLARANFAANRRSFAGLLGLSLFVASIATVGCAPAQQQSTEAPIINGSGIIAGAESTGSESFSPYIAALYDLQQGALCTASIYNEQILITAAHCVDGADPRFLRVIFGLDLSVRSGLTIRQAVSVQISPVWPVRQFAEKNTGDIALVQFSGGLPAGFRPAQILTDTTLLANGANTLLAGYGANAAVRTPQGTMDHTGAGKLRYTTVPLQDVAYSASEILVDNSKGRGACHGDSGGPAYIVRNGQTLLWGITSRGVNDPNNDCSVAAAYTSIPFYSSWIRRTAERMLTQPAVSPASLVNPIRGAVGAR